MLQIILTLAIFVAAVTRQTHEWFSFSDLLAVSRL